MNALKAHIRAATANDVDQIISLFEQTVKTVGSAYYTSQQTNAWASAPSAGRFHQAIHDQFFIVATLGEHIVGFGSLDKDYIDFLYTHKDYQRRGLAQGIYAELERHARTQQVTTLESDVSKAACQFFQKQGFTVLHENENEINGITIINYRMQKRLF